NLLAAANTAATAAASAIRMAGGIVAAVREMVRDLVAQTVGRLAVWAAELVFSVGLATPLVAGSSPARPTNSLVSRSPRKSRYNHPRCW
ncbi:hypothetical protein DFR71_3813, partial [Nocardia alba]